VADINVERRGPSIWPWIIGLIVLAVLVWVLVEMFGDRGGTAVTDPTRDTLIVDRPMMTPAPAPLGTDTPGVGTAPGVVDTFPGTGI